MLMSILAGLIISVDAFFIGLSLGLQERCKLLYLVFINMFLLVLCIIGFFVASWLYDLIPVDPDLVVGFSFIAIGVYYILHYFLTERKKHHTEEKEGKQESEKSLKTIIIVGFIMSVEAMLITMGIVIVFWPYSTIAIPITVAFAHFGYSVLSFSLAKGKQMRKIPPTIGHVIAGLSLVIYGLMAIFVDFGLQ
ncbi:MAG: manganese efflux pump [Defluviitaleaceae bacterium]|nr:manganese efflux pump [Defluviitaleaceae bacterium]